MLHQCFACFLVLLPLFAAADPIKVNSELRSYVYAENVALGLFDGFSSKFGRNYGTTEEHQRRFAIFRENLETIDRLNREERGTAKYGITRFADLTFSEFQRNFTGGKLSAAEWQKHAEAMEEESDVDIEFMEHSQDEILSDGKVFLPKRYDYRKKKAVTPVKSQGDCQSCWAFCVIANIEGVWAKKHKTLINLSEQELLDCDNINSACDGGLPQPAVKELVRLGGVAKAEDYPYVAKKQSKCLFKPSMAAVKVAGTKSIPANENKIARALIKNGPLSVGVYASVNFMFYEGGIFDPTPSQCSTNKDAVNHGVAIVAFGEANTGGNNKSTNGLTVNKDKLPYWVIKNSWSEKWGEHGYMKIVRGKNACSIKSFVSTAVL